MCMRRRGRLMFQFLLLRVPLMSSVWSPLCANDQSIAAGAAFSEPVQHRNAYPLLEPERRLWSKPNSRNLQALRSTLPRTLAFAIRECCAPLSDALPARVHLHIAGATYAYEGRSDWRLLKAELQKLAPQVAELHVLLNFGDPWQLDSVPAIKTKENLARIRSPAVRPLESEEFFDHDKLCSNDVAAGIFIRCVRGFYQHTVVPNATQPPDVLLMVNPGIGQWWRRTWDPVIRYALEENIITIISTSAYARPTPVGPPGGCYNPFRLDHDEQNMEIWMAASTMHFYGAQMSQTLISPFPLIYMTDEGEIDWKGAVVMVFRGLQDGMFPCKPRELPKAERDVIPRLARSLGGTSGAACPAYDMAVREAIVKSKKTRAILHKEPFLAKLVARLKSDPSAQASLMEMTRYVDTMDKHYDD